MYLVLCSLLVDVLFARCLRPWGAYPNRTVGKVWVILFVGFFVGFVSERMVAYKLIGLYEPIVIFLWQASPSERAGALPMFFFVLPFWLVISMGVMGVIIRKQAQTQAYLRRRIDAVLKKHGPDKRAQPVSTGAESAPTSNETSLQLPTDPGVGPICPSQISHITAEDHYLRIYYEKNERQRNTLVRMTLKEMLARLPADRFVQAHRSHLVNLEKIIRLKRNGQSVKVYMACGKTELPVSRYRLPKLMPVLETVLGAAK